MPKAWLPVCTRIWTWSETDMYAFICLLLSFQSVDVAIQEILVLVLFPFYAAFQPPMTALCRKIGPRIFLPFIVTSWGIVMMCHGLSTIGGPWSPCGALWASLKPATFQSLYTWSAPGTSEVRQRPRLGRRMSNTFTRGSGKKKRGLLPYGCLYIRIWWPLGLRSKLACSIRAVRMSWWIASSLASMAWAATRAGDLRRTCPEPQAF